MTAPEIKIDKDIPIPVGPMGSKYPLGKLEVGDSFFIEGQKTLSGVFGQHKPKKFSVRTVTENGVKGVRVWRVL